MDARVGFGNLPSLPSPQGYVRVLQATTQSVLNQGK